MGKDENCKYKTAKPETMRCVRDSMPRSASFSIAALDDGNVHPIKSN